MSKNINPKDLNAADAITGAADLVAIYQPSAALVSPTADPEVLPTRWRVATLNAIKTWLADFFGSKAAEHTHANKADLDGYNPLSFAPAGDGASAVAAHLMELDPHTQYVLATDLADAVKTLPPNDDNIYVMRNGAWEILNIS